MTSYLNGRPLGLDQILMNVVVKVCERTLVKMAPLDGLCLILVSCNILRMTFSDIPFLLDWGRVRMGKRTLLSNSGHLFLLTGAFRRKLSK